MERLAGKFEPPFFARAVMEFPALSLGHFREFMERSIGPMQKLIEAAAHQLGTLSHVRGEFEALAAPYYFDNVVRQDYLLTRAMAA